MRLYGKLALVVLLACAGQAAISSGVAGDACFAARCLVATRCGDTALEQQLVAEYQEKFAAERPASSITTIALSAAAPR